MVQEIRSNQPQYTCIISIERLTGNQEEEIMTFGVSADEAKNQAEQLLASTYGCNQLQVEELIQQAKIQPITHWCAPKQY
jgi:ribosomal protein L23